MMKKVFEDEFMEVQSDLVALCLEVAERDVEKVFVYCSIEEKSRMFNAFFEVDGKIQTTNQMGLNSTLVMQFLKVGTSDLERIKNICTSYNMQIPTEIKLFYDAKTGKLNANYEYKEICSAKTGKSAGEVFLDWISEMKQRTVK